MPINNYKKLEVFKLSYQLANEIFGVCKDFPKEEKFSLTSQIIKSSRSVPANIVEGWAKRKYEPVFKRHLIDAVGSLEETVVWLNFAKDCKYLTKENFEELVRRYDELGKKLLRLHENWKTF